MEQIPRSTKRISSLLLKSLYVISTLTTFAERTENESINDSAAKRHMPLIFLTTNNPCSRVSLPELSYLYSVVDDKLPC